jgi:hypothetical protein
MTIDSVELYRRATGEFRGPDAPRRRPVDRGHALKDSDVRALVRHVVEEDLWAPPLFAGRTIADVGDSHSGDLLRVRERLRRCRRLSSRAGRDGPTVHLSVGDVPGSEYAMQLAADHLVHAWDLARSVGADPTLDAESVAAVRAWFANREDTYRASRGHRPPRGRCRTSCWPDSGGHRDRPSRGRPVQSVRPAGRLPALVPACS